MIAAGITSFKIEGRLKDSAYVKNVTAFYRQQLDAILGTDPALRRASSGKVNFAFTPDLSRTFNRGFTTYFLKKRERDILSRFTPKSVGKKVGQVVKVDGTRITVRTEEQFHAGDGICYFDSENRLCGTRIQKVEGEFLLLAENAGIAPGTELYRNYDAAFAKELDRGKTKRTIEVELTVEEVNNSIRITAEDEDGVQVTYDVPHPLTEAQNAERAKEILCAQLSKSGATIFYVTKVSVLSKVPFFLPMRDLNEMRRKVLELLEHERLRFMPQFFSLRYGREEGVYPLKALDASYNVANSYARQFYERHGVRSIQPAVEVSGGKPEILMTTKHCLRFTFGLCRGKKGKNEPLILEDYRYRYTLEFDCEECVMKIKMREDKEV